MSTITTVFHGLQKKAGVRTSQELNPGMARKHPNSQPYQQVKCLLQKNIWNSRISNIQDTGFNLIRNKSGTNQVLFSLYKRNI